MYGDQMDRLEDALDRLGVLDRYSAAEELEISDSAAAELLRRAEREGVVSSYMDGRRKRYISATPRIAFALSEDEQQAARERYGEGTHAPLSDDDRALRDRERRLGDRLEDERDARQHEAERRAKRPREAKSKGRRRIKLTPR
jgi:hypothetical protein